MAFTYLLLAGALLPGAGKTAWGGPAAPPTVQGTGPVIQFLAPGYAFGELRAGQSLTHTFIFRNAGTQPLVLSAIGVSCGCTSTSWTRTPIRPGQSGQVIVVFDTTGKLGRQHKLLTVESNSSTGPAVLWLSGQVNQP